MDMRWLRSPGARLRLVGVVNRLDRRDFHDLRGEAGCGEMRLIFRLAYGFTKDGQGQGRCRRTCRSTSTRSMTCCRDRTAIAGRRRCAGRRATARSPMPDGWPAGRSTARHLRFRQLELNAQVVRFPSGQEPQFGGQAVYLMRIFGIDGDADRRTAAGEHARRGAHFGGRGAQGRARRLCQGQCAGDRPGRLHDPRPAAGAQGDLLFDLRQCAAGQPSVLAAAVAAGFRRPRSLAEPSRALARGAAGAAGQRHLPGLPSVGCDGRLPLHRPRRQIHLAAQPHRGGDIAAFPRRTAAPRRLCRRRSRQAASRTGSGRCRSHRPPSGRTMAASPMPMPTCRSLA